MKVMLVPTPNLGSLHLGIQQCARAWLKWLPRLGVELVDTEDQTDIVHMTIGTESRDRVDVLHLHGLHPTGEIDEGDWAFKVNAKVIENMRKAKTTICVSQWVADILKRDMHFAPIVIPNGVDMADWNGLKKGTYSDAVYALWGKNRVGGVCDPKPMNELARRAPEVAFVSTFGEPADNVRITGLLPFAQMKSVINDTAVYLALAKETWGIQTLEAMACGVPVLGFRWGGTKEIIEHGVDGYLAEPGDYDDLVEGLYVCLKNRKAWGKAGREKIEARYQWRDLTQRIVEVYEEVLKPHMGPKVTVVIPCYNYGKHVGRAIRTVLEQSFADFELIVVDDGSADESWGEIQDAIKDDPRARAIRQENMGVAHARNRGIAMGAGEYIACLDADDGMAQDFLAITAAGMDRQSRDVGIVYTGLALMREDGYGHASPWPPEYDFGYFSQLRGNCVPSLCLFRREAWERAGGYKQRFKPIEDGDLWMRMGILGFEGRKVSREPLFLYNQHVNSATLDSEGRLNPHPDNLKWQPWMKGMGTPPFACLANPPKGSWPVHNYDQPKVSVVIPVGPGHETLVEDALDSLLAQTEPHWEAIVVNDTGKPLNLMGYPFARTFTTKGKGKGPGAARNIGIASAEAPLILCLDADDYLEPEFLEQALKVSSQYGDIVYTDCWLQRDGETLYHEFPDWNADLLFNGTILAMTALFPKAVWEEVGGFDERLDSFEDWVFWIDACIKGHCGTRIPWPGFTYRHLTGQRREEGVAMKAAMRPYFERKYGPYMKGEAQLSGHCGSCGGRRAAVRQIVARNNPGIVASPQRKSMGGANMADPVLIRYIGGAVGKRIYKGPSGGAYRFDAHQVEMYVRAEDVDFFAQRRDFVIVEVAPPPPKVKKTPPPPAPTETVIFEAVPSLSNIKGIGLASEKKLKEAGITRIAEVALMSPEALGKVLGLAQSRIAKIVESAKAML